MAMRGAGGEQSSKETHIADRKIDTKLYTLYSDPSGVVLDAEFLFDAAALPPRFSTNAVEYMTFLRKWGRYLPSQASFGGTVVITMKFETSAEDKDWSFGVEAQFDSVTSGAIGVEGNGRQASLASNSEISLLANGGKLMTVELVVHDRSCL